ncbi:M1 family aminopeptidase [uncultured Sanguibacteroides sp.]|uniref:M1 family metallopeptidase n=1 Tax=uncultured Sanguibacteroides sp. TaxID=1635151 RepID=UPI0025CC1E32|nr:M1 family aminopeptidase [uncultured Sanguibacteroides sp.]
MRCFLAVIQFCLLFAACERGNSGIEKGVSKELAQERKSNIGGVSYNLYFTIPSDKEAAIIANSEISFELLRLAPVVLDFKADKESIISITSGGEKIPYTFKNEHIVIEEKNLREGRNSLNIKFRAGETSLNRNDDFLYTLLVPDRCRTLMPCFDQPDIKGRFKLKLKIPSTWRAVANGDLLRMEQFDDYKLYEFEETKPLSTYLFAFVAGVFDYAEWYVDRRWIGIYYRETDTSKINGSLSEIAREVAYSLNWMEKYTGRPYPFDVYNVVAIPAFQFGGMEHPGATYYHASRLFLDPDADMTARLRRSEVIAHETAHMWFGDLVTMKWFDDVWLKEVFANFMAGKILSGLYPTVDHKLNFYLSHYEAALRTDRTQGTHPILQKLDNLKDAGTLYGDIIYHKAPIVMNMLENLISDGELRRGLRHYLRRWAYSNADWNDLITLLEETSGVDLQAWNEIWVKEAGAPLIEFGENGVEMIDESGKSRIWPQRISVIWESNRRLRENILFLKDTLTRYHNTKVVLPDGDVLGYGCFLPTEYSIHALNEYLSELAEPLHRAVSWQLLYEGVLNKKLKGELFVRFCIKHLPAETNNLVINRTLSFLTIVYNTYLDEGSRQLLQEDLERFCMDMLSKEQTGVNKKTYFKTLLSIYTSSEAKGYIAKILYGTEETSGMTITDEDRISIAYNMVLRDSNQYQNMKKYILRTVKNKDLLNRFTYVLPSVSGKKQVRDSVFNALLLEKNRVNEVWAGESLRWLNHPLRRQESEEYIPKVLEKLQEIQETGDIFFPSDWLEAGLSGHTSKYVYSVVTHFLEKHPNYPQNLKLKILSNSDHLRRLHAESNNLKLE